MFQILSLKQKTRTLSIVSMQSMQSVKSVRDLQLSNFHEFKALLLEVYEQTKSLCKSPHLKNTILTCFIQFGLTAR